MKKRSLTWLLISVIAISMFLAGCGSKSTSSTAKDDTKSGSKKDTLVYGRGGDSTSLDPITTTEGETFKVTINIFENLVNYGKQDTTLHPGWPKVGKYLQMD